MSSNKIFHKDIYCIPVTKLHIKLGWLEWMNNPQTTKYLFSQTKIYTEVDLLNYLNNTESEHFLACYSNENIYFGNLRIYKFAKGIASVGRLIGNQKFLGKDYGQKLSDLAISIIFNNKTFNTIIVGNNRFNKASAVSKIKSGFKKLNYNLLLKIYKNANKKYEYYILKKEDYNS
jgi:predicted GNAT family N-acyltransferase